MADRGGVRLPPVLTDRTAGMALYIFSDAHLGAGPPETDRHKLDRIAQLFALVRADGDRLVILGDLFDFWFEYKHAIPKGHTQALFMLKELTQAGVHVDYVSGNHDFWMGDFFQRELGLTVHRDRLELTYAGRRLLLMHGDGLAPADRGYRVLKWVFRHLFASGCIARIRRTGAIHSPRRCRVHLAATLPSATTPLPLTMRPTLRVRSSAASTS